MKTHHILGLHVSKATPAVREREAGGRVRGGEGRDREEMGREEGEFDRQGIRQNESKMVKHLNYYTITFFLN